MPPTNNNTESNNNRDQKYNHGGPPAAQILFNMRADMKININNSFTENFISNLLLPSPVEK
jgi:hypothetical protein